MQDGLGRSCAEVPSVSHAGEVFVCMMQHAEVHLSFRLQREDEVVGDVAERQFSQFGAVAGGLGTRRGFKHVGDGGSVASKEGCLLAVAEVVPRSAGIVGHFLETGGHLHGGTDAAQVGRLRRVGHLHVQCAVGIESVVILCVAERSGVKCGPVGGAVGVHGGDLRHGVGSDAVAGVAGVAGCLIVLHPAEVRVVKEVVHVLHDGFAVIFPSAHLSHSIDFNGFFAVADVVERVAANHGTGHGDGRERSICCHCGQGVGA